MTGPPHAGVLGVLGVHVVAFLVGHHLEGQLVVVAQEQPPLGGVGDLGGAVHDLHDRGAVLATQGHEHPRHHREVEGHVALVTIAEVRDHIGRPLVGLGQQHPARVLLVDFLADPLQELVGLGQVLAVGALTLEHVGHGIEAEPVQAHVQPEPDDLEHDLLDLGVVVVEVRLVGEEAVPVEGLGLGIPGPVGGLGVDEDDAGVQVALVGVGPHVPVALGRAGPARLLEPGVLVGGVVHHHVGDHPDAAGVGRLEEVVEVAEGAVVGQDREVVADVVAAVAQRGLVDRQQPDAVDPQPLQVVEPLGQPAEVALAVAVAVLEPPDVQLVEDRGLVPE
jgi:hypothetical protein